MNHWIPENGLPFPLGCTWKPDMRGFNFALYSKAATALSIRFYDIANPANVVFRFDFDPLHNKTSATWHCFIHEDDIQHANCYAYCVNGPDDPGNAFDPTKLLLDPWARAIYFPGTFSREAAISPGDNTGKAALAVLVRNDSDPPGFENDKGIRHYHDLIIYEMHVRGFTRHSSSGVAHPGTFRGIIEKIPYLVDLGVTALELIPVHQFDPQENNYWGYMTLNFFAPHQRYGSNDDPWDIVKEFKEMVQALHKAGIEVILDVIYNHTVEGGEDGPNYSYKGIDNSSYYLLTPHLQQYIDHAGTGNVMRTSYKMVRKLVLDSLRYWVQEMHVDGYRFDLASIFTRNDDGSVNLVNPPILEEISLDPVLAGVHLIAEPWDTKEYQLGKRFPGASWGQWNGAYRDDMRKFIKSDPDMVAKAITRIYGSDDLFPQQPPFNGRPFESVNFVASHDGFSLYDLVSYNTKHNQANGHNNTDGTDDNFSWNCGVEGDDGVTADIMKLRKQQAKNFTALLMFSNGVPMFRMGDEFLQTQHGNNNPYNQDNEISWLDWDRKSQFEDVYRFFKLIIACRKSHPAIGRGVFWNEDVRWFGVNGPADISFHSRTLAYYINGGKMNDDDFYVIVNMFWEPLDFTIGEGGVGEWKRIIDTSADSPNDIFELANAPIVNSQQITSPARTVIVLQRS